MVKLSIVNPTDRIYFEKGAQKKFIRRAITKIGMSQKDIAARIGISPRTLTDWLREKYSLSYKNASLIAKMSNQKIPRIVERKAQYWSAKDNAVKGGVASYAKSKFGNNEAKRLARWKEWWQTEGNANSKIVKPQSFIVPKKSAALAELVGILLGDGGITTYQCNITLNSVTDYEYSLYVEDLITKLFGVPVHRYAKGNSLAQNLSINRKGVVDFLISIGLQKGNKLAQGIKIPSWILGNKEYSRACVRGLIDTDGCVIHEIHRIKGKIYRYARLNFTSASIPFVKSVMKILETENLEPKVRRGGTAVQLEKNDKIWHYFKVIGTSNPKHLRRWRSIAGRDV